MNTDRIITLVICTVIACGASYNVGEARGITQGKYEVDCYEKVHKTRAALIKVNESPCLIEKIEYDACKKVEALMKNIKQ